ncbi:MAG TPA: DUF1015 domain-containing protein [Bryobacterales bacterium]|nr:DUF1015 domain-containing protein [Bryobacterales bacterium]
MANVYPFRAFRYAEKAGPIGNLVTQPYDKIPPDLQQKYYAASPYNFVRLSKGLAEPGDNDSSNVYTRAAADMEAWIRDGILAQDAEPAFYPYFQEFEHPETGERLVRQGFIGLTEALPYEKKAVFRHELTHSGPKLDRLQLTRHTKAHLGQIFVLYDDPARAVEARLDEAALKSPLIDVSDHFGVRHRVWKIDDPAATAQIQALMSGQKILIADGHHRYETALAYARENAGVRGADRVMMTFVNMRAAGLVVLATHRVLTGLGGFPAEAFRQKASQWFEIEDCAAPEDLQRELDSSPASRSAIGVSLQGAAKNYLLRARPEALDAALTDATAEERSLDVVVLHKLLLAEALGISEEDVRELKNINYVRGFDAAIADVRSGAGDVAFLLRPVDVQKVGRISFGGGVMPQKSTDFYPKMLSGLTVYQIA